MIRLFLSLFTLFIINTTFVGCAQMISAGTSEPIEETGKRTMGSMVDDHIIETKAAVNIDKASPELARSHIVIVSYNGIVLLAGQVKTEDLRQLAAETVAKIAKVRLVHNEITVAGNTSLMVRSNDSWITTKIKSRLLVDDKASGSIKVVTENSVVYLMGVVTRAEADQATEIARTTSGVQKVVRLFEYL